MPAKKGVCQTDEHKKARLNSYQKTMGRRKELESICRDLVHQYEHKGEYLSRGDVWVFVQRIVSACRQ
jgi:hypothetical protein